MHPKTVTEIVNVTAGLFIATLPKLMSGQPYTFEETPTEVHVSYPEANGTFFIRKGFSQVWFAGGNGDVGVKLPMVERDAKPSDIMRSILSRVLPIPDMIDWFILGDYDIPLGKQVNIWEANKFLKESGVMTSAYRNDGDPRGIFHFQMGRRPLVTLRKIWSAGVSEIGGYSYIPYEATAFDSYYPMLPFYHASGETLLLPPFKSYTEHDTPFNCWINMNIVPASPLLPLVDKDVRRFVINALYAKMAERLKHGAPIQDS